VNTSRKWLVGCGVGCAVVLLAGTGACVAAALYMKHTFRGIEKAATSQQELVSELGQVLDYVPPADGVPRPERLRVFVEVREATAGPRAELDALVKRLPPPEFSAEGPVLGKVRVGLEVLGDLIDKMGTYLQARNRLLVERGMSVGEYVYLYTLAYHSWLGHAPAEAPKVGTDPDGVRVGIFEGNDALFGEPAVRRRYRRYVLGFMHALVGDSAGPEAGAGPTPLEREIQRLEVDPGHVLWEDGLPPPVEAALQPFRDRLEATWDAATNRVELPLAEHETPWEWQ
jgi:hypothetical protein